MIVDKRKLKKFLLAAVLMLVLVIYLFRLTYSGLWYDEGVEYFYSKYMSGRCRRGCRRLGTECRTCTNAFAPPISPHCSMC